MEDTEPTAGSQEADNTVVLMGNKPLHRFIRGEPRYLGIIILFFGAVELLMGIQLNIPKIEYSGFGVPMYIPLWQGALFLIAGNLSLYTGVHPSKRMVTVCLAMYVVTLLGIPLSVGYRIGALVHSQDMEWNDNRYIQLVCVEAILFVSSLFVSTLLLFLTVMARLALKSTNTLVILKHTLPTLSDPTAS